MPTTLLEEGESGTGGVSAEHALVKSIAAATTYLMSIRRDVIGGLRSLDTAAPRMGRVDLGPRPAAREQTQRGELTGGPGSHGVDIPHDPD